MAGETYKLSLLLEASDRASNKVNTLVNSLLKLRNESKQTHSAYSKLQNALNKPLSNSGTKAASSIRNIGRDAAKSEKDVDRLGRKIDSLNKKQVRPSSRFSPDENYDTTPSRRRRNGKSEVDRILEEEENHRRKNSVVGRFANVNDRYLEPTRQIAGVWRENYDSLSRYTDAATKLIRAEAGLKIIGLSPGDQQSAFQFIDRVSKDIRGVSKIDITKGMVDAVGAFGDVQQAGRFLPSMMRYKMNLSAYFGEEMSPQQVNHQMLSSAKALEYIGVTQKGEAETDKWMQEFVRISASTGGRVTPDEILTMLRRGKVATRGLTPEGLRASASLIEDFGAPTAGTAMMSLYQQLVGGVMKESAVAQFQKYGLLKEGGFEFKKGTTTAKKVLPGGNILGDLMQQNPMEAGKVFLEKLRAGGLNTDNQTELRNVMAIMFQNRNAFAYMDSLVTQRQQIEKEAQRMGVSADTLQQQKLLDTDKDLKRLKQLQEYEAQMENFRISMGQNLIPAASKFMNAATPILQFIGDNPNVATWGAGFLVAAKGLSFLSQSASLLSNSGNIVSWFSNSRQAADLTATSFSRAGNAATTMRQSLMTRMSAPLPIALKIGAIIGLEEAIRANVEGYFAAKDAQNRRDKVIKDGNKGTDEFFKEVGQPYQIRQRTDIDDGEKQTILRQREQAIKVTASGVFSKVNDDNDLLQSLGVKSAATWGEAAADKLKMAWWVPGMKSPYAGANGNFSREKAVQTFRKEGDQLKYVEVMKEFIRALPQQIPGGDQKSQSARSEILEVLKLVQPDSFKQAQSQLQAESIDQMKQQLLAGLQITQEQASAVTQMMQAQQQQAAANTQSQTEFAQSLLGLSQPAQSAGTALSLLPNPAAATANALGLMPPPVTDAANQMGVLASATNQVPGPLTNIASSANATSGSLDGLTAKISSFQMPVPQIQTFAVGVPGAGVVTRGGGGRHHSAPPRKSSFNIFGGGSPASVLFPSKASGGKVTRDGFAEIHANELIVPASVTRRYEQPRGLNQLFSLVQDADGKRGNRYEKPRSVIQNVVHNADGKRGSSMANLIQTARDADAVRSERSVEIAGAPAQSAIAQSSTSGQSKLFENFSMPVTIKESGSRVTAADIKRQLMAEFSNLLDQHMGQIENSLARSFDFGRERE
ncbi:MAG TPA: hypothetical protein VF648_07035 [Pyrinomonadaceae bacterium]|jgi:hypothetical protein